MKRFENLTPGKVGFITEVGCSTRTSDLKVDGLHFSLALGTEKIAIGSVEIYQQIETDQFCFSTACTVRVLHGECEIYCDAGNGVEWRKFAKGSYLYLPIETRLKLRTMSKDVVLMEIVFEDPRPRTL